MKLFRWLNIAAAACALAALMPSAHAADQTAIEKCLAASFYPDGSELYGVCSQAIAGNIADAKVRARVNLQLGQALYFAHRPGMALPFLDAAIQDDPDLVQAYRRRGWAYHMTEQKNAAMADFTEFLARSPDDPDAHYAIVVANESQPEDCKAGAKNLEAIVHRYPTHFISRYFLARDYACVDGEPRRQLEELNKIIEAGREAVKGVTYYSRRGKDDYDFYALARRDRLDIYTSTKQIEAAITEATWLIENYPNFPDSYVHRSNARIDKGDFVGGLEDAERSLKIMPGYAWALGAKADALYRLKRPKEVVDATTQAIASGPNLPIISDMYHLRGVAHKALGNVKQAKDDFISAMTLDPKWIPAVRTQLSQRGYLFGELARFDIELNVDFTTPEFRNALDACMIDPECYAR